MRCASGYLLETPSIPRYSSASADSENASGADNQQERPGLNLESSETIRRTSGTFDPSQMMIESVLYGDIQRPAEMPGPRREPE